MREKWKCQPHHKLALWFKGMNVLALGGPVIKVTAAFFFPSRSDSPIWISKCCHREHPQKMCACASASACTCVRPQEHQQRLHMDLMAPRRQHKATIACVRLHYHIITVNPSQFYQLNRTSLTPLITQQLSPQFTLPLCFSINVGQKLLCTSVRN